MQPDYTGPIRNTAHSKCSYKKPLRWYARSKAELGDKVLSFEADEKGMIRTIDLSASPAMGDTEPIVPVFVAN